MWMQSSSLAPSKKPRRMRSEAMMPAGHILTHPEKKYVFTFLAINESV